MDKLKIAGVTITELKENLYKVEGYIYAERRVNKKLEGQELSHWACQFLDTGDAKRVEKHFDL